MITKKDIVREATLNLDEYKQKEVSVIFDAIMDAMKGFIGSEEKVFINQFGTFDVLERAPRNCRNPQTGETMVSPAKKVLKFKAAKSVKDSLNA